MIVIMLVFLHSKPVRGRSCACLSANEGLFVYQITHF